MIMDNLIDMLGCVEADGRVHDHAIVKDDEVMHAPAPAQGGAPLLQKITLKAIGKHDLLLLPDQAKGKAGVMSPLLSTTSPMLAAFEHQNTSWNRSCDGVLIRVCPARNDGVIPIEVGYFDLKSGNPVGYAGQFMSTQCFFKGYVLALLDMFFQNKCEVVRERFVIFHTDKQDKNRPLQKKRSVPKAISSCRADNADKYIVKNGQEVNIAAIL